MSIPTEEPLRLLQDPAASAGLKADMGYAAGAAAEGVDYTAGLTTLKSALATQTAVTATTSAAGSSVAIKVSVLAAIAGGAIAVWAGTQPSEEPPAPERVAAPVVATERPDADVPAPQFEVPPPPPAAPVEEDAVPLEEEVAAVPVQRPKHRVEVPTPLEPKVPSTPGPDFVREAKLVAQARRSLGGNPSRALALTEEAANEFPRGQLVEEREAIAIRALAKLGRDAAARSRAERFLRKHAKGPHADAVRRATGL